MDFSRYNTDLFPGSKTPSKPKVSVCLITYNHEAYIRTCLDSILCQETNFEYEIVIGEDRSTDQTAQIIEEYALKYPDKIKAYIRKTNIGSKLNYVHCFFDCIGEYIVHIEGDDYFNDPQKLQIQADFLDANPSYSACFHNALMLYEDETNRENHYINPPDQPKVVHSADFLVEKETWFMATASVMMRKKHVATLPEWFLHSKSGDIPLYVILAEQAPIAYIDRVMSVYRRHLGGISYTDSTQSMAFLANRIFMYAKINEHTKQKYKHLINPILGEYYLLAVHAKEFRHSWLKRAIQWLKAWYFLPTSAKSQLKIAFKESLLTNFIKKILKIYFIFR